MSKIDGRAVTMHNLIFPQSLREAVLPELEQFFQRCELRGVSREDARACISSKFILETVEKFSDDARAMESKRSS